MDDSKFIIPLNGLTHARRESGMDVGKEFFERFDNKDIKDASLHVLTEAWKAGQDIEIDCTISGHVSVECDRCLGLLRIPVGAEARLCIRSGDGGREDDGKQDREVVHVGEGSSVFDISQVVYDYVCLSLPLKRTHPDGECDPEVLRYLESGIKVTGSDDGGNPFSVLGGLFGN